ncbi:MAG TPA: UDP-N-acetylmuramoyl-L-alanyl-D-glutamate--2,6-diaminopimelate ligase [Flavobacteriales bacterium]|nr:UDP-N-acetylmuramoyl-L-alanyl-D-glutamate--2,6-diaminopimelate ligase [Flavobacteriales bacterium]
MKLLSDILYGARITEVHGTTNLAVESITSDSRQVRKNGLFVAIKGTRVDGHTFIYKAIESGATAIVCEELPDVLSDRVSFVKVSDAAQALGIIASNYYDNPSEKIKVIGITGTNGKTTTVTLMYNLFRGLGYKCGLLSTVVNRINEKIIEATHTTPDQVGLNKLLAEMVEQGCKYCFMEVSSHAVDQKRIAGVNYAAALFSNITHDHLDYHKTFEAYIKAKKRFFDDLSDSAVSFVNKDDFHWEIMVQNTKSKVYTYAIKNPADIKCRIVENDFNGLMLNLDGKEVWTKLVGMFNAYNLTAAYAVARHFHKDELEVLTALSSLSPAEGRFDVVRADNGVRAIVDYAHTPDALKNVLQTIREIRNEGEKIITVVGCGGDRDTTKRPVMATIACEMSDKVVLTSDNPRSEDPNVILDQMMTGVPRGLLKNVLNIADRAQAIKTAISLASRGDIVLVAGKGHEKYQEIKGVKYPFDDKKIIEEIFKTYQE